MDNSLWEKRYRYLEQNMEQMLIALDRRNRRIRQSSELIRKLSFSDLNGIDVVLCNADGMNLLYQFEFLSSVGEPLFSTGFIHANVYPAFPSHSLKISKCIVTVRATDSEGAISTQEELPYTDAPFDS